MTSADATAVAGEHRSVSTIETCAVRSNSRWAGYTVAGGVSCIVNHHSRRPCPHSQPGYQDLKCSWRLWDSSSGVLLAFPPAMYS